MSLFYLDQLFILTFNITFDRDYLILANFYPKTKSQYEDGIVSFQNITRFSFHVSDSVDEKQKFRIKTNHFPNFSRFEWKLVPMLSPVHEVSSNWLKLVLQNRRQKTYSNFSSEHETTNVLSLHT